MESQFTMHKGNWHIKVFGQAPRAGSDIDVTKKDGSVVTKIAGEVVFTGAEYVIIEIGTIYSGMSDEDKIKYNDICHRWKINGKTGKFK